MNRAWARLVVNPYIALLHAQARETQASIGLPPHDGRRRDIGKALYVQQGEKQGTPLRGKSSFSSFAFTCLTF